MWLLALCATLSPAEARDRDGDGLTNRQERRVFHTNPRKVDTDGDGWSDFEEVTWGSDPRRRRQGVDDDGDSLYFSDEGLWGTDPRDPDSDDDGVGDGDEVRDGTNPTFPWFTADTRVGGTSAVEARLGGWPGPTAVVLTTTDDNNAKAQLLTTLDFGLALSAIDRISYATLRSSASTGTPVATASLNVEIVGTDAANPEGATTLVFEPYMQVDGVVVDDVWQTWDAAAGRWWSTQATSAQPVRQVDLLTWDQVLAAYPDARIVRYGFNLGSYNPGVVVAADSLQFGDRFFDF
jgi:hypothetical protein